MVLGSKAVDVISALRGELPQSSQALKKKLKCGGRGSAASEVKQIKICDASGMSQLKHG
jgi:hypothetical protein